MRISLNYQNRIGGNSMERSDATLIRTLVYKTGLDVLALAVEIDASEKSIYKWMNGTSLPNCRHLLALLHLADSADERKHRQDL